MARTSNASPSGRVACAIWRAPASIQLRRACKGRSVREVLLIIVEIKQCPAIQHQADEPEEHREHEGEVDRDVTILIPA